MNSNKFLFFCSGAPDSTASSEEVAMFWASDISHFEIETPTSLLIFLKRGNDQEEASSTYSRSNISVRLTILTGSHKRVMKAIAEACTNLMSSFVVVADSQNSVFISPDITACAGIAIPDATGLNYSPNFQNVVVGAYSTNNIALTDRESGSLVTLPVTTGNSTITLPASPSVGANYEFVAEVDNDAHTVTIAGAFEGTLDIAATGVKIDGSTSIVIGASKQKIGDNFKVVWTGTNWFITGTFIEASAVTHS